MELAPRVIRTEDDTVRKTLADLNRRASTAHGLADSPPRKSARALLENERQRKYFPAGTIAACKADVDRMKEAAHDFPGRARG